MGNRRRMYAWLGMALWTTALAGLVWAQGLKGKSGAAEKEPAEPAPAASAEGAKAAAKAALPAVARSDPAVEAVLDTKPGTPSELVRAGRALAGLKRPDLARQMFRKALAANLGAAQLVELADEFGGEAFVQIASRAELAPEGPQLAEAVLAAKAKQVQDPKRLAGLIERLKDPSPDVRSRALAGLQEAGAAAVGPLMAVLVDPQRAAEHPRVRGVIAALGPETHGLLLALSESTEPKLALEAAGVLSAVPSRSIGLFLLSTCWREQADSEVRAAAQAAVRAVWGYVPRREEAVHLLADLSKRYSRRVEPLGEDAAGQVVVWSWDGARKQAVPKALSAADAARWYAARFARDACAIAPGDKPMRLLYLVAALEQAAYESGLDAPLSLDKGGPAGEVAALGAEAVEEALAHAMRNGQAAAATAAARILGQMPSAERLLHRSAEPCPLVLATRHPDRRVRLAAVEAVVRMQPVSAYAGASYIPEALAFLAASSGARRVLIGGPSFEESRRLGGELAKWGYEAHPVTTGRELVRQALQSPDYEMVLVDSTLSYPTVDFVLQSLRRDGRTALLPVGVLARAGELERARHLVRNDPRAEAFSRPHDEQAIRWQLQRLAGRAPDLLPAAERRRQAAVALDWLGQLSAGRSYGLYDLRRTQDSLLAALAVPELSVQAAAVLGNLGAAEAQQALVEAASRATTPPATRRAALDALRSSIERYGVLLTTAQIRLQYDRYNQTAKDDTANRAMLGLILDCIEAPAKAQQQTGRAAEDDLSQVVRGDAAP